MRPMDVIKGAVLVVQLAAAVLEDRARRSADSASIVTTRVWVQDPLYVPTVVTPQSLRETREDSEYYVRATMRPTSVVTVLGCTLLCACGHKLEGSYVGKVMEQGTLHTKDDRAHAIKGERGANETARITKLSDRAYRVEVAGCSLLMRRRGEAHLFIDSLHRGSEERTCKLSYPKVHTSAIPMDFNGYVQQEDDGRIHISLSGESLLSHPEGGVSLDFHGVPR